MKYSKIFFIFLLCALCASCSTAANLKQSYTGPLTVYVKQEFAQSAAEACKIIRATTQRAIFTIENNSDDFIVVRNINIIGQLPDPTRWYGAAYGSTQYQPRDDIWVYSQSQQVLSGYVFASGVIAPGASFQIERWALFKENYLDVEVTFQKLSKIEAAKYLDFGQRADISGPKRNFKRLNNSVSSKDDLDWSLVIFPKAGDFKLETQRIRCNIDLKDPELSLVEVKRKAGCKIQEYVFSKQLDSWLVKCKNGIFLINKRQKILMPDMDFLTMAAFESQNSLRAILPLSGYEKFKPKGPKIEEPGYFNPGITEIPKDRIIELLQYARDKHDKVRVLQYDPDGLGKRAYILIGEFEQAKRKGIAMEGILE